MNGSIYGWCSALRNVSERCSSISTRSFLFCFVVKLFRWWLYPLISFLGYFQLTEQEPGIEVKLSLSLTLSHIQLNSSTQLWNQLGKHLEHFFKRKHNYWIDVKTLCQEEKLHIVSNYSFCHNVFFLKSLSCRGVRKCLFVVKG